MNNTLKGTLKQWNEDRGFGFIRPEDGKRDIFIHISALKKMARKPIVGDIIFYQVHTDNDGKNRAVNATIQGVTTIKPRTRRKKVTPKSNTLSKLFYLLLFIFIAAFFLNNYFKITNSVSTTNTPETSTAKNKKYQERKYQEKKYQERKHQEKKYQERKHQERKHQEKKYQEKKYQEKKYQERKYRERKYRETYSCTGKIYCSQMSSCKEATFYLRNCPGTKMDGDGDGVPCESQWCSW